MENLIPMQVILCKSLCAIVKYLLETITPFAYKKLQHYIAAFLVFLWFCFYKSLLLTIHIEPMYCALLTQYRNVRMSAECLDTKGFGVIKSMCRMDSQNRQCGVMFVLMSRFPDCMLISVETIISGKLPESRVINCDCFVLNEPCVLLSRPVSWAEHGQDASADIHGYGGGIQGDLLWHHATGAADRSWWCWGFCHWRYKHFTSKKCCLSINIKHVVSFSQQLGVKEKGKWPHTVILEFLLDICFSLVLKYVSLL